MRKLPLFALLLSLCVSSIISPTQKTQAATITVTTTTDELNTDGDCSLREAIQAANTNIAVDACPAGSDSTEDTIILASGAVYVLALNGINEDLNATGDFDIIDNTASADLAIQVSGVTPAQIDANYLDRSFHILGNATVSMSNLVIMNGYAVQGAGIFNNGNLTLNQTEMSFNTGRDGTAIYNLGLISANTLVISNNQGDYAGDGVIHNVGTIDFNGFECLNNKRYHHSGCIYNDGVASLNTAVFSNNSWGDYPPIYNELNATFTLLNINFINNLWSDEGPFIWNLGTITISNTNFLNNTSESNFPMIINSKNLTIRQTRFENNNTLLLDTYGDGNISITETRFLNNQSEWDGIISIYSNPSTPSITVTSNCFVDNMPDAVQIHSSSFITNFTGNWWGASNGPGPIGPGDGDTINSDPEWIDYSGFLTSPILGCPYSIDVTPPPSPTFTDTPSLTPTFTSTNTPSLTSTFTPPPTVCVNTTNPPTLLAPTHRTHTTNRRPRFTWTNVPNSQSYRFMIYLEDRSFEFKKRLFVREYTMQNNLARAKYLWRVRTQDATCSTWSNWSSRNTLFID